MSETKLVLIESEGLLFRGIGADHPTEIWDYPRSRWVAFRDAGPKEKGWGRQITARDADALKKDNPAAEHFMYYDLPPWSQPLSQAYRDAITPEHVKKRLAEIKGSRTKS